MSFLRFFCRFAALIFWVLVAFCALILIQPFLGPRGRDWLKWQWSRALLRLSGIQIVCRGTPIAEGAVLLVSNHVSWLDIYLLNATRPTIFIAKSEIRRWPILGWLVAGADTIFIERASRHAVHKVGDAMQSRFSRGQCVGLFPEGTTSPGFDLLPFYANLFEPARKAAAPIQPVALIFYYQGERSDFAAFVGEETLLQNLRRVLGATGVMVEVEFLAPIWVPEDGEPPPRAELGRLARHAIHEALARRS